ncbi:MAG: right-handed parallel beta-helix repeat-containing protein [Armatimonadetes bacterium]|nr:right-handed parallel beta-helix repeat-containing protein [Armatimonadota bacterium]
MYAPVTDELLRFVGEAALGVPVENITLRGLNLRHADWSLEPEGHSDPQAVCTIGAAITVTGASSVSIENCDIAHVGRYAVWLRTGSRACRIVHNQFHDLGAGAVRVGETAMANDPADQCAGHTIDNNYIHDYGIVYAAGVGIYVGQSSDNTITHNEIHDGNYSGMSIGWNWGSTATQCHRNVIADNHIHHVMRGMLSDGAGIYTLGTSTGTILRHNHIHDILSHPSVPIAWGVYLDAESNQITVESNLCHDTTSGGLMMHNGAHENVVRNNIFARGALQTVWRAMPVGKPADFERNIVYVTQGNTFYYDADPDLKSTWNHNLYWRTGGREMVFNGGSWDEWLELGLDRDSLIADPQFMDPEHGDFRLKPTSPAITKLGFQPFDVKDCGLYGEPAWVALPHSAKFPPTVLPAATREEVLGHGIDDGFETTAVGQPPADAVVYLGEIPGGHVAVSDEQAASGKCALKLTDAPGLKNNWDPHCFYQPNAGRGTAVASYKLWIGSGALPWLEMRYGANPYHAGPSLQLGPGDMLMANGRPTLKLPREQWVGVEVACPLGKAATGAYDLTLSLPGAPAQRFAAVPCHAEFRRLTWFGFVSLAADTAAFYVDDLKLEVRR